MRKRILRNCLLFVLLTLLLNTLVFYLLAEPVLYKGYVLSKQQLGKNSNFLMGDSHAGVIRQQDLDRLNITNFAYNSESYFDVYNKLHYLTDNFQVDTLYLCVDDHTISMYRQSWSNRRQTARSYLPVSCGAGRPRRSGIGSILRSFPRRSSSDRGRDRCSAHHAAHSSTASAGDRTVGSGGDAAVPRDLRPGGCRTLMVDGFRRVV